MTQEQIKGQDNVEERDGNASENRSSTLHSAMYLSTISPSRFLSHHSHMILAEMPLCPSMLSGLPWFSLSQKQKNARRNKCFRNKEEEGGPIGGRMIVQETNHVTQGLTIHRDKNVMRGGGQNKN